MSYRHRLATYIIDKKNICEIKADIWNKLKVTLKRSINFRLSIRGVREKYLRPRKPMKIRIPLNDTASSHLAAFRRGDTG